MSMTTDRAKTETNATKKPISVPILKADHFAMAQVTDDDTLDCDFEWWASRIFPPNPTSPLTIDERVVAAFDAIRPSVRMESLSAEECEEAWLEMLHELSPTSFRELRDTFNKWVPLLLDTEDRWAGWDEFVEKHNIDFTE